MAVTLDDITRKKLILVKQLFQRALIQTESKHNRVDGIMALIGFDLANETILKAVITSLDSRATPSDGFHGVIQQVENKLSDNSLPPLPNKANIQHIHNLRNDAQHKAKYPNESDVSDCRTNTRDFLQAIVLTVWSENFEFISLVELIQDSRTKGFLVEAETELKNKNFTESIVKSIAAFDLAMRSIGDLIVGRIPSEIEHVLINDGRNKYRESREVFEFLDQLRELNIRSLIGLNLSDYLRYFNITNSVANVWVPYGPSDPIFELKNRIPTVEETEFVINYVTDAVIRIENF
jgi:hypothetical protein